MSARRVLIKSVYHNTDMFILMFCKNGLGEIYCLYFHTWLSTAKLAGLRGNVNPSGNYSNCRKRKSQTTYLWSKPQYYLLIIHWYQTFQRSVDLEQLVWYPTRNHRLSQLLQGRCVSMSYMHHKTCTSMFCGLLIVLDPRLPAPASLAPFARVEEGERDISLAVQEVWAKNPASFTGCLVQEHRFVRQSHLFQNFLQKQGRG